MLPQVKYGGSMSKEKVLHPRHCIIIIITEIIADLYAVPVQGEMMSLVHVLRVVCIERKRS